MARVMLYISDLIVPFLIFYVVMEGLAAKRPVYDDFVKGAKDGLKTVVQILPTLVGLMVAVGVLRASGFLDFLAGVLGGPDGEDTFPVGASASCYRADVLGFSGHGAGTGCF